MTGSPLTSSVTAALPSSLEGKAVLTAYFRDVVSRDHGREATRDEVESEMREDPSDDLCPPTGLFLVARRDAAVVGCIGLLLLPGGLGEVRRVFVDPSARGRGVGAQLMRAVEDDWAMPTAWRGRPTCPGLPSGSRAAIPARTRTRSPGAQKPGNTCRSWSRPARLVSTGGVCAGSRRP